MTPGSTITTRTSNARISWARHSLNASRAHFDAAEAAESDDEFVARVKREFGLDLTL